MSDDIRSLIRAAQEAEGRREPLEAAGHLQRAAERLERSGRPARAIQLLRHAVRLSGDVGLSRHLEALEREVAAAGPPQPSQSEGRVFELDVEDADGELPFRPPPGTPGALNPRAGAPMAVGRGAAPNGTLRPGTQAPGLQKVPSPLTLVGSGPAAPTGPQVEAPPARTYRSDAGVGGLLLAHHVPVLGQVEVALAEGMRVVLLLGPQGSGRSTCLSALTARLGGVIVGPPFAVGFPPADLLLIDDAHRLEASAWGELERALRARPKMRLVLAAPRVEASSAAPSLFATTGAGEVPLWTTAEILTASPQLPPPLAGRVERVVEVSLPLPAQLERLARELLTTHRPDLADPGAVAAVLVEQTLNAPRGLHELISLVHRLPMDVRAVRRSGPRTGAKTPRGTGAKTPRGAGAKTPRATTKADVKPGRAAKRGATATPGPTRANAADSKAKPTSKAAKQEAQVPRRGVGTSAAARRAGNTSSAPEVARKGPGSRASKAGAQDQDAKKRGSPRGAGSQ
ncbi:MAG TPA: hypothetical protein VK013_01910 [Myxococcaceae bacterium]|nr:hypothetical protein [Myxococcaceae bacterium]